MAFEVQKFESSCLSSYRMPKQQNENEETKEIKIEQKKQLSSMMEEGDAPTFYIDEKLNLERADYSQEEKSSSFYH